MKDDLSRTGGTGPATWTSTYTYDAVGRLVEAVIPHHDLTYGFASTSSCGVNTHAGLDGNRTSMSDVKDGGTAFSTSYCYDNADRLTSSVSVNAPAGVDPVNAGLPATSIVYDGHGNTTTLADQSLGYNEAD
ncbi:MAG: hypothetical protein ABJA11_06560, partial [Pseudolysinimonas sp.]